MHSIPSPEKTSRGHLQKKRKEAVEKLGLLLPVTEEDVKQAYRKRARETHPDRGGAAAEFKEVQQAFDEAVVYAERNGKRLPWIGAQMPIYVAQREAIERVESLGGRFQVETLDWLEDTVGSDFALLADRLKSIDLSACVVGDDELHQLLADPSHLPFLETVSLADTSISDASAIRLARLPGLRALDLRGTRVSFRLRKQLAKLPQVERVEGVSRFNEWLRGRLNPRVNTGKA